MLILELLVIKSDFVTLRESSYYMGLMSGTHKSRLLYVVSQYEIRLNGC